MRFDGMPFVFCSQNNNLNLMNLKDELLNFFTVNDNTSQENYALTDVVPIPGLCQNCGNRPHCGWVETKKIYCEHYE